MYDYEHVPQIPALPVEPIEVIFMSQYGNRFLSECDGIISTSSRLFETGPIEQWQEYLNPQPVLAVGPLSDPENVKLDISRHWDVVAFLDGALEKFGPYSVVYISFGSVLWPSEPDKLWTVVDVLVQEENPFILSHASPVASILDSMMEKIKAFGFGFAAKWVPQQLILQHEACGWFLTYGINKRWCTIVNTQNFRFIAAYPEESSSNRICWPFSVDQPVNAANVSTVHNIGYELLEVRNGHGLRPLHRLGNKRPEGTVDAVKREILDVLYMARGEDGKAKRMRAQSFKYKLSKDTTQGGRAYTDLDRLAQIIV
ncbi:uncharacterized protein FOMMEDRAFT_157802 [Fomitiporia mediterranea MF3/22]|uniref:uncharacterized protein n=1 Tax=Fomitiporia mediterranea (strain MF3/22) TaxID=694068 RepID=UPI000440952C|nr:uncharacterized protein FOMMEDRAFT_157802 [Fomitiporia mediterranea MF3/22]EJD00705.1 hypothetical protein FOMMEDRAFT_157802 [Fomitiporia mediterranea MF3/22]